MATNPRADLCYRIYGQLAKIMPHVVNCEIAETSRLKGVLEDGTLTAEPRTIAFAFRLNNSPEAEAITLDDLCQPVPTAVDFMPLPPANL